MHNYILNDQIKGSCKIVRDDTGNIKYIEIFGPIMLENGKEIKVEKKLVVRPGERRLVNSNKEYVELPKAVEAFYVRPIDPTKRFYDPHFKVNCYVLQTKSICEGECIWEMGNLVCY